MPDIKITKLKIHTVKGEHIHLAEIEFLSFGNMTDDRFSKNNELFIVCKQGQLRFPLDEVDNISFTLDKENCSVRVDSEIVW